MKTREMYLIGFCMILALGSLMQSCGRSATAATDEPITMSEEDKIARGKYLVDVLDCQICHTPKIFTAEGPVFDTTRTMSGHIAEEIMKPIDPALVSPGNWIMAIPNFTAWYGPWGVSYAQNLTPDDTGIGTYELDHFKRALREGKYRGMANGRSLLPPMPWQAYSNLPDEDIEALFAYLKSLPPVKNLVPPVMSYDELVASVSEGSDAE